MEVGSLGNSQGQDDPLQSWDHGKRFRGCQPASRTVTRLQQRDPSAEDRLQPWGLTVGLPGLPIGSWSLKALEARLCLSPDFVKWSVLHSLSLALWNLFSQAGHTWKGSFVSIQTFDSIVLYVTRYLTNSKYLVDCLWCNFFRDENWHTHKNLNKGLSIRTTTSLRDKWEHKDVNFGERKEKN